MPRISLSDIPVEVHFEILEYVFHSSQKWKGDWIEKDNRNPSQFPYNVAAVCRLWLAILTKIPECWTRVIIDVASDPHDFLDIFLWSQDLRGLAVTITNSHTPDPEDVDYSELERQRVSAIVDALRPHVSRCQTITFEVAFLTSLPSPIIFLHQEAPHLTDLALECKINNAGPPDDYSRSCDLGICEPLQTPATFLFPSLRRLAMTGFWFMFIASHPYTAEWFKTPRCVTCVFYRIFCFEFQKEGQYTLQNFVALYAGLAHQNYITLCDLSLNHDGPILEGKTIEVSGSIAHSITFKNVSSDVLQTFFFLAKMSTNTSLAFDNCTFPDGTLETNAGYLTVKDIPLSGPANSGALTNNTNLCKFLANWSGSELLVNSCPSFDDNALLALSTRQDSPLSLGIWTSPNFTAYGLRQFLKIRNRLSAEALSVAGSNYQPLYNLQIDSHGPWPSYEDEHWFRTSLYTRPIDMRWCVLPSENSVDVLYMLETHPDDLRD